MSGCDPPSRGGCHGIFSDKKKRRRRSLILPSSMQAAGILIATEGEGRKVHCGHQKCVCIPPSFPVSVGPSSLLSIPSSFPPPPPADGFSVFIFFRANFEGDSKINCLQALFLLLPPSLPSSSFFFSLVKAGQARNAPSFFFVRWLLRRSNLAVADRHPSLV